MTEKRQTRFHGRVEAEGRACAVDGCPEGGEFRAPLGNRGETVGWQWLCLDHVRAFNARYNYFDGMDPDDVARAQFRDPHWDRKTWPFATNADAAELDDPMGIFEARYGKRRPPPKRAEDPAPAKDRRALSVLQLGEDATLADIRRRYTALVRRYHPDSNGGDRSHEARLQDVIDAYTHLKTAPAYARQQ
jgi:DnaJ domain